ncbi:MAG: hypothetical protein PHY79_24030 [Anaerolineae bacterium]|nr:hypothetical protein [Anaerolineae bacterium]
MAFGTAADDASDAISVRDMTARVDGAMARVAVAAFLLGVFWIWVLNWAVAGWVALALSPLFLWLARQFAIAPCLDDVGCLLEELDG